MLYPNEVPIYIYMSVMKHINNNVDQVVGGNVISYIEDIVSEIE